MAKKTEPSVKEIFETEIQKFIGRISLVEIYQRAYLILRLDSVDESESSWVFHFTSPFPVDQVYAGLDEDDLPEFQFRMNPGLKEISVEIFKVMENSMNPISTPVSFMRDMIILARPDGFIARLFFEASRVEAEEKNFRKFFEENR